MQVMLVGKGPSAQHAPYWDRKFGDQDLAVINDAGKLLPPNTPIKWLFFTDKPQVEAARSTWDWVSKFVSPDKVHLTVGNVKEKLPISSIEGLPLDRCLIYPYRTMPLKPDDHKKVIQLLKERVIVHHHTATAAVCHLAYSGYTTIRMVGFDGGKNYARGVKPTTRGDIDLDKWRKILVCVTECITQELGVNFVWLPKIRG